MNPYHGFRNPGSIAPQWVGKWLQGETPLSPAWYRGVSGFLDGHLPAHQGKRGYRLSDPCHPESEHLDGAGGEEAEIPPTEDLMREHGVLARLLLVYEEGVRRILAGENLPPDALHRAAQIVRAFIEDYHEQLEELWVFPRFQQTGQFLDLVQVLMTQHQAGRLLTDSILQLSAPTQLVTPPDRFNLARACALYIRMYRPHEAREDTVLFPQLRKIVAPDEFAALGERFEWEEHRRFGEEGFDRIVEAVAEIERQMGIHNLAQFTP